MVRPTLLAAIVSLGALLAAAGGVPLHRLALGLACVGGLSLLGPRRRRLSWGR